MKIVEILILTGAMPSSITITHDVLTTANRLRRIAGRAPAFDIRITGSGGRAARAFLGDTASADASDTPADLIIVPGLGLTSEADVTALRARRDAQAAKKQIVEAVARGAEVATSCSGVFLFADAGVLDNRRVTSTWWLAPVFRALHPDIALDVDALVVRDGPVTTAGAALAQMDLMLALVAAHADAALARHCARYLLLDARRSQSRYMALAFLAAADPHVATAEAWARKRLHKDFSIDDMASAAGLAPRTFARHVERASGLSPVRFLQRLRIEVALELLETTKLSFDEVARRVGYAEPSTLRRIIRRDAGEAPSRLRSPAPRLAGRRG